MKAIACILSIAGYFIGYWIFKSIFHSFLNETTTIEFIVKGEWIIAGVTAALICLVNANNDDENHILYGIIPIAIITFIAMLMPVSLGFAILYNIITVGAIVYIILTSPKYQ